MTTRERSIGELKGRTEPRIFTPPLKPLEPRTPETEARTAGYDVIDFAEQVLKLELFPWQKWLLIHALELRADGEPGFRFKTILVLVARQNGKTVLGQVIALWFMYVYGAKLVLGTAQDLDTAEETWEAVAEYVDPNGDNPVPELAAEVKKIWRVNGKKAIELKNRIRYKVKASSKSAARGLSGDLILLDELREHRDYKAWGAISKTTMARPESIIWCMSNAGDIDSIVLAELRKSAHKAIGDPDGLNSDPHAMLTLDSTPVDEAGDEFEIVEDEQSLFIAEWSTPPEAKKGDRQYWGWANPSLGYSIPLRNLAAAAATDPDDIFRTECMCQWVEGSMSGPFPSGSWEKGIDPNGVIAETSNLVYCVDMAHDRRAAWVAVAGWRPDGEPQVEIAAQLPNTDFVESWFKQRANPDAPIKVVAQAKGAPITSMIDRLAAIDGVELIDWSGTNLGASCGQLFDMVKAQVWDAEVEAGEQPMRVWHLHQPVLDAAAQTAVTKPLGDAWVWDRAKSPMDCSPLMAFTGALWGLMQERISAPTVSVYESSGLTVLD